MGCSRFFPSRAFYLSFRRFFLTFPLQFLNFIFLARALFVAPPAGKRRVKRILMVLVGTWPEDDSRLYSAAVGFPRVPPLLLIRRRCLLVVSWPSDIGEPSYFLQRSSNLLVRDVIARIFRLPRRLRAPHYMVPVLS